jgi:hypothetical protein
MARTDAAALRVRAAEAEVEAVAARLRPRFRRRAAHRHAGAYLRGLPYSDRFWVIRLQPGYRLFAPNAQAVRIGALDAIHQVADRRDSLQCAMLTALHDPYDAKAWGAARGGMGVA